MSWRVGYPDRYRHLDDQHDELGEILMELAREDGAAGPMAMRRLAAKFFTAFKAHGRNEESVMAERQFADYDLHKAHHEHATGALETLISYLDRHGARTSREDVVRHLENKLTEETFVDRSLATFLASS